MWKRGPFHWACLCGTDRVWVCDRFNCEITETCDPVISLSTSCVPPVEGMTGHTHVCTDSRSLLRSIMFFVQLKYAFTGEKKKTDTLVNELLLANQQALLIFVLPFLFVSLPSNLFFVSML